MDRGRPPPPERPAEGASRDHRQGSRRGVHVGSHLAPVLGLLEQLGREPDHRLGVSLVDQGGESSGVREDLEQRGAVEGGGDACGAKQRSEGTLGHGADAEAAVAQAALGLGPDLVAEVARGVLDQHVLLAGEVAEEGRPADARIGDHVLHPGGIDPASLVERDRCVVDAIALLGAPGLRRGGGEAGAGTLARPYPTRPSGASGALALEAILSMVTSESDTPYGFGEESGLAHRGARPNGSTCWSWSRRRRASACWRRPGRWQPLRRQADDLPAAEHAGRLPADADQHPRGATQPDPLGLGDGAELGCAHRAACSPTRVIEAPASSRLASDAGRGGLRRWSGSRGGSRSASDSPSPPWGQSSPCSTSPPPSPTSSSISSPSPV